jgi:hypothetical protein
MNALYLTLALRLQLLKVDKTPEAGAAADREYDFLRRWINLRGGEKSEPDNSLFNPSGTGYLVRERVATYAEQNGKFPPVNGYNKDATWLGDQGLMLAAMAERHQLHPEAAEALGFAYDLWRGAHAAFKGRALTPTLKWPQEVGDDGPGEDYDFGKGIFWRSLLHAFNRSTHMRSEILATIKNEPDNFIYKSAEAACNTDLPEGATGDEALCNAFNVLATLTAADQILGGQQ